MARNIPPKDPAKIARRQAPENLFKAIRKIEIGESSPVHHYIEIRCTFDPAKLTAGQREHIVQLEPVAYELLEQISAKTSSKVLGPSWGKDPKSNEFFASVLVPATEKGLIKTLREELQQRRFKLDR